MTRTRTLDVYEAAYLAGGPRRATEAAVVSLMETGVLRATRSTGELRLMERRPCRDLEAAVLDVIGINGGRSIGTVCWRLRDDVRLTSIGQRLKDGGLLARDDRRPESTRPRFWSALSLTGAGRRTLRQLRRDLTPSATDVLRVGLRGPEAARDPDVRAVLLEASRPPSAPTPRTSTPSSAAGVHDRYAWTGPGGGSAGGFAGGMGGGDCGGGGGDGGGC